MCVHRKAAALELDELLKRSKEGRNSCVSSRYKNLGDEEQKWIEFEVRRRQLVPTPRPFFDSKNPPAHSVVWVWEHGFMAE